MILDDSCEAESKGDESDFYNEGTLDRCAKCGQKFVGAERCSVIGCDTKYCNPGTTQDVLILITRTRQ